MIVNIDPITLIMQIDKYENIGLIGLYTPNKQRKVMFTLLVSET